MFVTGRVLDPQGKPVPNATVMVHARLKMSSRVDQMVSWHPVPIGHGGSDRSGLYRFDAPRISSAQYDSSALSPWRRATVPAGSGSTSTPISRRPTSRSDRSN